MIHYSIDIIDDDESIRESLIMAMQHNYQIKGFPSGEQGLASIKKDPPDLVLLDVGLPGVNGIEVLTEIKEVHPRVVVIMITGHKELEIAVKAMKLGAYDYVTKPLHLESLEVTIRNATESLRLRKEVEKLQDKFLVENVPCIVSESDSIQDIMEMISMVAKSKTTPVMILGETGTGKELIARAIHYKSANFQGPLVSVNCAAIPKELIESELFGYEKGAFSGALQSGKRGLIEEAQEGTLFLDEVADLSPEAQAKLLRFLENGEFYRVGSTRQMQIKTRVISATNKEVEDLVEKSQFREDLYYRLGVVKLQIPSLNERREDILTLAKHFVVEFSREFGKEIQGISKETQEALRKHHWRGNIRELKNVIERAVLVSKTNELTLNNLGLWQEKKPPRSFSPTATGLILSEEGVDFPTLIEEFERSYYQQALELASGNESQAARLLNLNNHTFRYRYKKLSTK